VCLLSCSCCSSIADSGAASIADKLYNVSNLRSLHLWCLPESIKQCPKANVAASAFSLPSLAKNFFCQALECSIKEIMKLKLDSYS
jgi:hypothetical protein